MTHSDKVLLVHGLAETRFSMSFFAAGMRLNGFDPILMDYPSTRCDIQTATNLHLAEAIEALQDEEVLHIVSHSQGGIMLRYYLQDRDIPNLGRVVMLAPGHAGSGTMRLMRHHPLFPVLMGPAGLQSADDEDCFGCQIPRRTGKDVGILAGCLALDPMAWLSMSWPNDGKIAVDATKLDDMNDHMVLPVTHDSILSDAIAVQQTANFLRTGSFLRKNQTAA